jgi:putative ABC transport system permease protein
MLLAAVVVVLLIACSHAASLLLARSSTRARELSMRSALGAGRGRLIRQLLVESVLTALLAGVLGVALASFFIRAFANEMSLAGLPYWTHFTFDPALTGIIVMMSVATGIAFGVAPAIQQSRTNVTEVLNQFGRSGMASPRSRRLTTLLLVGELAVSVTLVAAAASLVRSANVIYAADRAVDLDRLWEFRLALPANSYPPGEARDRFFNALEERLAAAPGLESAALAGGSPFNSRESRGVVMDGQPVPESSALPQAPLVAIGPRYFETLGLRIVRGNGLDDVDAASRGSVAVVNERFVARFSPENDPIGRDVTLVDERTTGAPPRRLRIVGVAPPLRQQQQNGQTPVVYVPFLTQPAATASLIVRGDPQQFAAIVRNEVRRLDPDLPVFNLRSLALVSSMSRFYQRITSTVFSIVAIIGMALSALGLYAVTAFAAAQRTQEVGVRMALGAHRSQVTWLFLRQTLAQVAVGLLLGMAGAIAVGMALQGVLVDVTPNHPLTLAAIAASVTVIALLAAALPARRAARLDPVTALRQD